MTRKKSDSYHDYLIESLKDPEEAAAYLEVALEEEPNPVLLKKAFMNVLEALGPEQLSPEQLANYREVTSHLFEAANSQSIYTFINWFNQLGFKLMIVPTVQKLHPLEASQDLAIQTERA